VVDFFPPPLLFFSFISLGGDEYLRKALGGALKIAMASIACRESNQESICIIWILRDIQPRTEGALAF
jgi:hypothetical protein